MKKLRGTATVVVATVGGHLAQQLVHCGLYPEVRKATRGGHSSKHESCQMTIVNCPLRSCASGTSIVGDRPDTF